MSISTVTPKEAYESLQQSGSNGHPTPRLIDVRTPGEYRAEHAEPAELIPMDRIDPETFKSANGSPIYLICASGNRAKTVQQKLAAAGVTTARLVEGGTEAWKRAGLPLVKGRGAISMERQVRIAAGAGVLIGVALGWLVHPGFYGISAFVGAGLLFAGVTDFCGMAKILARMPWNRGGPDIACSR